MDVLNVLNPIFWVISNILLAYSSIALSVFLIAYFAIFDPRSTTGGKLIFWFMLSLVGVIILSFLGIFVDPSSDTDWWEYPFETVDAWRPVLRLVVYAFVAYSITTLAWLLVMRKWYPHKLKKASDLTLVKPRHTTEIPIITDASKDTENDNASP